MQWATTTRMLEKKIKQFKQQVVVALLLKLFFGANAFVTILLLLRHACAVSHSKAAAIAVPIVATVATSVAVVICVACSFRFLTCIVSRRTFLSVCDAEGDFK